MYELEIEDYAWVCSGCGRGFYGATEHDCVPFDDSIDKDEEMQIVAWRMFVISNLGGE